MGELGFEPVCLTPAHVSWTPYYFFIWWRHESLPGLENAGKSLPGDVRYEVRHLARPFAQGPPGLSGISWHDVPHPLLNTLDSILYGWCPCRLVISQCLLMKHFLPTGCTFTPVISEKPKIFIKAHGEIISFLRWI